MVFYDAPRRAIDTVADIVEVLGGERQVVIARELTKTFETIYADSSANILAWLEQDPNQLKGEMVLMIEGVKHDPNAIPAKAISSGVTTKVRFRVSSTVNKTRFMVRVLLLNLGRWSATF